LQERLIALRDLEEERFLYGHLDRNLHVLRRLHGVEAVSRGGQLRLKGTEAALGAASETVEHALKMIRDGRIDEPADVERLFRESFESKRTAEHVRHDEGTGGGGKRYAQNGVEPRREASNAPAVGGRAGDFAPRAHVTPRSRNQQAYLDAIDRHTITFGIGPAGTGKSYLAVAAAVKFLRTAQFRKIVLCRPAIEAGESLGFLPGELKDKIDPYLRPLYDALNDLVPHGTLKRYLEEEIIEVLPLAYMRGRTLDHAVIILDEGQNATIPQMKMFLTRLGERSKMIVTGDLTQTDLPRSKASGLVHSVRILKGVRDIAFVAFERADVVRHPVVRDIIRAYAVDDGTEADDARGDAPRTPVPEGHARDEDADSTGAPSTGFGAGVFERGRPRRATRDRDVRRGPHGRNGRH
jgi:phosphate starvation-inducible protein PhoH and related proteins